MAQLGTRLVPAAYGYYYTKSRFGPHLPVIQAFIHVPGMPDSIEVEFLVDTGAAKTTLMRLDAQQLNIDRWGVSFTERSAAGFGGMMEERVVDATIKFSVGMEFTIPLGVCDDERTTNLPSLLGRDILSQCDCRFDTARNIVQLEVNP